MIKAFIFKTDSGLKCINFDNEQDVVRFKLRYDKFRELTQDEYLLFGDDIGSAGGEGTSIEGGDVSTAVISYTLVALPQPPTDQERAEYDMIHSPLARALVKREARNRNISIRQLMDEIMQDA